MVTLPSETVLGFIGPIRPTPSACLSLSPPVHLSVCLSHISICFLFSFPSLISQQKCSWSIKSFSMVCAAWEETYSPAGHADFVCSWVVSDTAIFCLEGLMQAGGAEMRWTVQAQLLSNLLKMYCKGRHEDEASHSEVAVIKDKEEETVY